MAYVLGICIDSAHMPAGNRVQTSVQGNSFTSKTCSRTFHAGWERMSLVAMGPDVLCACIETAPVKTLHHASFTQTLGFHDTACGISKM